MLELMPVRKIFVIDDDDSFCILLGYSVRTRTQAQSLDLDEITEAVIIFLDRMMPRMELLSLGRII